LGYKALEGLRDTLGERFINCGIAEQNMVSVAAGLAKAGMRPFVYSIGTFLYARAFEQIRNDVCFHDLPVTLIGNGAGFQYGVMGGTHHSLEDYGVLLTLRTMRVLVPAFDGQIPGMVASCFETNHPTWIRLGYNKNKHTSVDRWNVWHHFPLGDGPTIIAVGDIAEEVLEECNRLYMCGKQTPSLWAVSEFPLQRLIPEAFREDIERSDHLIIIEDHVKHGSIGDYLTCELINQYCGVPKYIDHYYADGPPYDSYGSRDFHRKQSGLDIKAILERIRERVRD
jgi:transketolase